jgi:hypothetical protein
LDDLTDVTVGTPSTGDVLVYDGAEWQPGVDPYGEHLVTWDGSGWRYRGATITVRPAGVATYVNGGRVLWDSSQDPTVTDFPTLAAAGDAWLPHGDVDPSA